MSLLQQRKAL